MAHVPDAFYRNMSFKKDIQQNKVTRHASN